MSSGSRLNRYALVATTVPLATLAGTQSATADIVYQSTDGLTIGGYVTIPEAANLAIGEYGSIALNAGHNSAGIQFLFNASVVGTSSKSKGSEAPLRLINTTSSKTETPNLRRFAEGDLVNSAFSYSGIVGFGVIGSDGKFENGEFAGGGSGYLGFTIEADSLGGPEYRYGWIGVDWDATTFELTIDGFAYETEAGVGIEAGAIPAPGALGLFGLAAGAAGIRRKRQG